MSNRDSQRERTRLFGQLAEYDQSHLLRWWDTLNEQQRTDLARQIESIDFPLIAAQHCLACQPDVVTNAERAAAIHRAQAPKSVVRQPETDADRTNWADATRTGEHHLREGRVAVITVAGGQGSRLGFEHPKGMFPIGPVSDRTLFQIFAEQILARRRRHQTSIPWFIMTSDATHDETVEFFERQGNFGLDRNTVEFFRQGNLPAFDAATGRILMDQPDRVCLSPDGHGGLVSALSRSGVLERLKSAGVETLFYHQVDNPAVIVCDPALLGFHCQHQSSLTTVVVRKLSPTERMGVLVDLDGHTEIMEYSELNAEQAARIDDDGNWIFWAGNTAIHVFDRQFLESLAEDGCRLPLHLARKNVAYRNDVGESVRPNAPAHPNAIKLERFIFDALPLASRTLIVEGNRDREFHPVKNRDGADSPATTRAALSRIAHDWLSRSGIVLSPDHPVELSPLTALDENELVEKLRLRVPGCGRPTD